MRPPIPPPVGAGILAGLFLGAAAQAAPVLAPGDAIVAIDLDFTDVSASAYPVNEGPRWAFDGRVETKYCNRGGVNSGLIFTPSVFGPVRSIVFSTANDFPERDPAGWRLYGTDDPVESADNSTGTRENWTLIAEGTVTLPEERFTQGPAVDVPGSTAYSSYKLIINATRDDPEPATAVQFSELQFFTEPGGAGEPLLAPGDPVVAVQDPVPGDSSYPGHESPLEGIDGSVDTKYLNFGKQGSGFIVTPSAGSTTVRSFLITTANDAVDRDPSSYELYGTNSPIVSEDNSDGEAEDWTLIQAGDLELPAERKTEGDLIIVTNSTAYTSYRLVFPTVKNASNANSMQFSEVQFYSDTNGTQPILEPGDFIIAVRVPSSSSSYANASAFNEGPLMAVDGDPETKYLNTARSFTGLIVTPASGPAVARSLVLTTANDAPGRDPMTFELYGTNDPIASTNNSNGENEAWTLVASGSTDLPEDRFTPGPVISFANDTAYASWRIVFPEIRDAGTTMMQIADVQLYTSTDGSGPGILARLDPTIAIQAPHSESSSPANEAAPNVLDGDPSTKYLNRGGVNSGFIVTPAFGPSIVTGFTITTANDFPQRDPVGWQLFGTNEPVKSPDHSTGTFESWTLIAQGDDIGLPDDRFAEGDPVTFANSTAYTSYRLIFTSMKDESDGRMQVADVQFEGTPASVTPPTPGFLVESIARQPNGDIALTWVSQPGRTYRVAWSTTLTGWAAGTVNASVPSGGTSTSLTFPVPEPVADAPAVFFRVEENP